MCEKMLHCEVCKKVQIDNKKEVKAGTPTNTMKQTTKPELKGQLIIGDFS